MYKVLIDYGTDCHSFMDETFETIDAAVKAALSYACGSKFYIVQIINWEAAIAK
jgi:hypothetical protein